DTLADRIVNGWMIAPNVTIASGFPVNVVQGTDLNQDSTNNDRPLFRGRNDTKGPDFREVNLRISRTFSIRERLRLEIIAEAENLLNSTNAACGTATGCSGAVVSRFGAADFLRVTSALNSRQIQLGGRIRF
ncbi:MAG TPA: TonB-dependent receptor, partial [Bryobacteraceae bacterium]|nr:TonB-dependent receptor [Bryobacteraceae bacterium]